MFDEAKIKKEVTAIIEAIGEDPKRERLGDTSERVAVMYAELFMGLGQDPWVERTGGCEWGPG